nr:tRNA lysidine(34) synthetase TilS [uncultured Rhodopila sp.]
MDGRGKPGHDTNPTSQANPAGLARVTPRLAVAVSGGADSMALAVLARDWTNERGGSVAALVVDHGLRPESANEATVTADRLGHLGVPARLLSLTALERGPALAERARIMRYQVLCDACRESGYRHLLLGHHAGDQIETVAMRALRGSHTHGLAGMAAMREMHGIRWLRPLLGIAPASLRQYLTERGIAWIEDPSNRDLRALRPRLRSLLADHMPAGATPVLLNAIAAIGRMRAKEEADTAAELAARAEIRPEGYALLSPGRISEAALSSLLRTIGGAAYPPALSQIADLAGEPRSATVAGVRIMPAGRLGNGWLMLREETAIAGPVPAAPEAVWDNRYRLIIQRGSLDGATIGKLGDDAARFRSLSKLPSAVLRTLPAIRFGKVVASVPHLGYALLEDDVQMTIMFASGHFDPCFVPGV